MPGESIISCYQLLSGDYDPFIEGFHVDKLQGSSWSTQDAFQGIVECINCAFEALQIVRLKLIRQEHSGKGIPQALDDAMMISPAWSGK